jgi:hypothetical protein
MKAVGTAASLRRAGELPPILPMPRVGTSVGTQSLLVIRSVKGEHNLDALCFFFLYESKPFLSQIPFFPSEPH